MSTIQRWNDELGDYEDIEVTQELVEKLRQSAIEFTEVVNNYLSAREEVDPNFKGVPRFSMEGDEDSSFDCLGTCSSSSGRNTAAVVTPTTSAGPSPSRTFGTLPGRLGSRLRLKKRLEKRGRRGKQPL